MNGDMNLVLFVTMLGSAAVAGILAGKVVVMAGLEARDIIIGLLHRGRHRQGVK